MHAGGQWSVICGSVVEGLCPDIRRLLLQTQLQGLWGSLPWEAAQRASRIIPPSTGPIVPTTCQALCTFLTQHPASQPGAPSSDLGKEEGDCSDHGSPPSLAIDISPCSLKAGSTHPPTQ